MDLLWVTIAASLVFVMQIGFLCLESGLVRSKNSINVAAKNITDFVVSCSIFGLIGFAIMFGDSIFGLFGVSHFFFHGFDNPDIITFFLFQMMFCGTAVTLVSGAVAERLHYFGYVVITIVITTVIYPFVGHWIWGGLFTGEATGWLEKLGFIDFAGSTVVHSVGGWVALAAIIVIGPRLDRFKTKDRRIPGSNIPMASLGALAIWFGWIGFNGGSTLAWNADVPGILLNTFIAACWGGIAATVLKYIKHGYIDLMFIINGVIGGLVAITACCHLISPQSAILVGIFAGVAVYLGELALEYYQLDDVIGVIPAHLFAGIWGTLAVAIFAIDPALTTDKQFFIQLLGIVVVGVFSFSTSFYLFKFINKYYQLRVDPEDELSGLNVAEHRVSTEVFDLLTAMELHKKNADFSETVPVEPFTEVGQIAELYNQVINKVNEEMQQKDRAFYAYKQSEFRNGAILEAAMDCIVTIDEKGLILDINPAAEKAFYISKYNIKGKPFFDMFLSDEKAKQAKDSLKNGFMVNSGFLLKKRNLMEMLRSDKTEFPAEIIITNTAIEDSGNIEYTLYIRDIAKRIKLEKRLKTLAYHDPLTGLFNRSYFMANLKNRIEFHKENAGSVALMFLDLDGFKKINDTLGHKAGDALLCEVGVRLKQITRDEDLVGRWGGDEFVVIISGDVPENAAQRRANSIVEVMRPPVKFEGNRLRVKASVGVAISNDGDVNADELLQQADIAMYQAKQGGKDTYRLFDKTMGDNTQHAFNIENALPDALKNNHLYMLYQPKVSCEDNKIVGFEALIRWKHPTYGMISPAEFIPILEASNLIITLGKWVITQAIKQLAVMKQAGIVDQSIAVNISGKHIHDSSLLTYIKEEADKYDADVSQLEIEITESVLASDTEASIAAMKKLSDSGIKLSIDDFGTGYSSLSYLRKFPIEILKIDRAFIRNCAEDADDASICLAIISLAKSLNLKLVAEGVETEQQLMFLQQHDCDAYQGFYFSKPLGSDAVLNLIQ